MHSLSFWHQLIKWDQDLFKKLNSEWINPFFDVIMPFLRNPSHWAPLYIFLVAFVIINFKTKGIWWCFLLITTVALTDMTGTYLFKHSFQRLRPCNDPGLYDQVRLLLKHCGGYSFVSNHAANHFGIAVFFFVTMRSIVNYWVWVGLAWAFLIAYSQIYVGVHYPSDVLCGALIGVLAGITTGTLFNKRFGFAIFDHQPAG